MGLNIVAHRRVSLKGFAQGWDDCFVIVRAASERKRREWISALEAVDGDATSKDEKATEMIRQACLESIERGMIINTLEDGTEKPYDFNKDEVADVVDALGFGWQGEVVSVATGADRLKATISSL